MTTPAPTTIDHSALTKKSVLVVDDEGSIRFFLKKFLSSLGVREIAEASNGQEALTYVQAHPKVNLVLLDLKMPVMDGVSVLKEIRAVAPEAAVVVVTGYPYYQGADHLFAEGAFEFVVKPVDIDYLEQIVRVSLLVKQNPA